MNTNIKNILVESNFVFQSLANNSDDYIYIWDIQSGAYLVSENMSEEFNIPLQGDDFRQVRNRIVHARDIDRLVKGFNQLMQNCKVKLNIEYQVINTCKEHVWVNERATIRYNEKTKKPELIIGVLHNLTHDGRVDNVTGLLMYDHCKSLFEVNSVSKLKDYGSIMLLGMDDFTNINTMNNHAFGDLVLRQTVHDLLELLDENTSMYRFDGDQFLIFAQGLRKDDMLGLYERIKAYQNLSHELNGIKYRFTVSAGIAEYPQDGHAWAELEKAVSMMLKKAKEKGKNRYQLYTKEMFEEKLYEQTLNYYLAEAVSHDFKGFHVVYQPVCYTQDLHVHGAEALLRFTTPENKAIGPDEFIPLLEQSQLILMVGLYVMEEALKVCKKWVAYIPEFVMNVNVSYLQLRDNTFSDKLEDLLNKYELDAKHITLELTESFFITDTDNIHASMKNLRNLHFQFAMDDFGTGYSSLARLSQFDVDVVKIDRSFVRSLNSSNYNREFVESVVRLCHNVGMKVCVEGIETQDEQASVCILNADFIQGFYVSRPVEEDAFFDIFIMNPYANKQLVVKPDLHLRHDQLRGDKDMLLAMMDASPMSLTFWNRDFEMLACNDVVLKLLDVKDYDELKDNFNKFLPESQPNGRNSVELMQEYIVRAFEGEHFHLTWLHCLANKDPLPMELTLVRIPYMDDYLVASFTRDMREQQAMERKIQKFNDRLKAILDATPLCLNLWNKKFENTMCNKEAVNLFKVENEQAYIEHFSQLYPEVQPNGENSDRAAIRYVEKAFEVGRVQFFWQHCTFEGELIPTEITLVRINGLDENGDDMVAGFTRDIREYPDLQRKLKERLS